MFMLMGQHGGYMVSTVASQQEVLDCNLLAS